MRGTAGFGAMLAAGRRPWMTYFCGNETQQRSAGSSLGPATSPPWVWEGTPALLTLGSNPIRRPNPPPTILHPIWQDKCAHPGSCPQSFEGALSSFLPQEELPRR